MIRRIEVLAPSRHLSAFEEHLNQRVQRLQADGYDVEVQYSLTQDSMSAWHGGVLVLRPGTSEMARSDALAIHELPTEPHEVVELVAA